MAKSTQIWDEIVLNAIVSMSAISPCLSEHIWQTEAYRALQNSLNIEIMMVCLIV